uniref:Uncharacterized protein n=1 Tax=Arundo donax TaxID=35708 RepID=A0A0A9A608_ARUDO
MLGLLLFFLPACTFSTLTNKNLCCLYDHHAIINYNNDTVD